MEFTVSRADLVRELNLSQGVVEKKTTIPILSNVLVEDQIGSLEIVHMQLRRLIISKIEYFFCQTAGGTNKIRALETETKQIAANLHSAQSKSQ